MLIFLDTTRIERMLVMLAIIIPFRLLAVGDCIAPSSLCERLEPNMVAFVGRPIAVTPEKSGYGAVTVTFDIQELLWGPSGLHSIRVLLDDGYSNRPSQPEFFVVKPMQDGSYLEDNCVGLNLPVAHPFVDEFRRAVAARRPASTSVIAQWHWYVPVAGTEVQLTSDGGRTFQGSIHDDADWQIRGLPPGNYKVVATRPNFFQIMPKEEVSILPASCASLRILMENRSEITGRVVDVRGEPVRNATFHLSGQGRSLPESRFGLAFLRDALFRRLGWTRVDEREYPLSSYTRTDSNGRFAFRDLFPGWYYLSSDISELSENFQIPLPNTYYPGVYGWPEAEHLVVTEGQSIHDILFRLPGFGPKRRVKILVTSEDGAPVTGAIVQDGGLDPANQRAANSGAHMVTDAAGQVILSLWAVADYRLTATLWSHNESWPGNVVQISHGQPDLQRTIILKGLRLKHG